MATRFYFHQDTSVYTNLPTAEQASVASDADGDAQTLNRHMDDVIGAGPHQFVRVTSLNNTNNNDYYFTRFVSHPINQSGIAANTWTYSIAHRENNAAANFPVSGNNGPLKVVCYVWRPGSGKVGDILDGSSASTADEGGANVIRASTVTFTGAAVAGATTGDHVVFEVWANTTQGNATSRNIDFFFDGDTVTTTDGTVSNHASFIETPENITFGSKKFGRSVSETVVLDAQVARQKLFAPGTPVLFKSGTITKDTTTGAHTQNFTSELGFEPVAMMFWVTHRTSAGLSGHVQIGIGFADGTNNFSNSTSQEDNTNNANGQNRSSSTACIHLINQSNTNILFAASATFGATGFDLVYASADAVQYKIGYAAWGGAMSAAISIQTHAGTGSRTYSNVGFQGNAAIFLGNTCAANGTDGSNVGIGIGATDGTNQWAITVDTNTGFTTDAARAQVTDKCIRVHTNGGAGSFITDAAFTAFTSTGYTLNYTSATTADVFAALVMQGGLWDAGAFNQATSNGTQQVTVTSGRTPLGVLLSSFGNASSGSVQNDWRFSLGSSDVASNTSAWTGIVDNISAGSRTNDSDYSDSKCLRTITPGSSPTMTTEMHMDSFHDGDFTVNNTTTDGTSRQIVFLAFSEESEGGELFERTAEETAEVSDQVARLRRVNRSVSESLTVTDDVARTSYFNRALSEVPEVADAVEALRTVYRTLDETVEVTADVARMLFAYRSLSESNEVADTVERIRTIPRELAEELEVADTVERMLAAFRTLSESLTVDDQVARMRTILRTLEESLTVEDAVARLRSIARELEETLEVADALDVMRRVSRALEESLTVVGDVVRMLFAYRTLEESDEVEDTTVDRLRTVPRQLAEELEVDAMVARLATLSRSLSESLTVEDTVNGAKIFFRTLEETVEAAADVVRMLFSNRSLSESLTVDAQVARIKTMFRTLEESLEVEDTVARMRSIPKTLSESLTVEDTVARMLTAFRTLDETPVVEDTVEYLRSISRTLTESLTLEDTVARMRSIPRAVSESLEVEDTVARMIDFTRAVSESLEIDAQVARLRSLARELEESLTVDAVVAKAQIISRNVSNSLTVVANVVVEAGAIFLAQLNESLTVVANTSFLTCWLDGRGPTIRVIHKVGRFFSTLPQRSVKPYTIKNKFVRYDSKEDEQP